MRCPAGPRLVWGLAGPFFIPVRRKEALHLSDIWLPGGGLVPPNIRTAQQAITQYDERLELGRDERHDTWVVLWKDGPGGQAFPVLGLGRELPTYDEIQRLLYTHDVQRHGSKLVKEVIARREAQLRADDLAMSERAGEVAEELEHAFRRMGETSYKKVFVPGLAAPA
jgi:hypothetical protein